MTIGVGIEGFNLRQVIGTSSVYERVEPCPEDRRREYLEKGVLLGARRR